MNRMLMAAVLIFGTGQSVNAVNLFHEDQYRPLIADRKATMPGDILTVNAW